MRFSKFISRIHDSSKFINVQSQTLTVWFERKRKGDVHLNSVANNEWEHCIILFVVINVCYNNPFQKSAALLIWTEWALQRQRNKRLI